LKHPFFTKFYNAESITKCQCPIAFDFSFEKLTRTEDSLRHLMFQEIIDFRPELAYKSSLDDLKKGFDDSLNASLSGKFNPVQSHRRTSSALNQKS